MLGIALAGFSPNCYSQKEQTLCEVTVTAVKPERFMIGQKVKDIDSTQLAQNRFTTPVSYTHLDVYKRQHQRPVDFYHPFAQHQCQLEIYGSGSVFTL